MRILSEKEKKQNGITQDRFNDEMQKLQEAGLSEKSCEKVILRISSANTVECLIEKYNILLGLGFTEEDIVKIAAHSGGYKNIQAVQAAQQDLRSLGFTPEQIVKIVAHDGGSKNIQAVQDAQQALRSLCFTLEQIVKIVAHGGGSKNITAVQAAQQDLRSLGFTPEQIVEIAANKGGSKNIKAVQDAQQALRSLCFTPEQIVKIAAHSGGSKNIQAVQDAQQELRSLGFTPEQIVKIVAHDGGSKNITAVQAAQQALRSLGFTPEQIVKIAAHGGGSKNIQAVQDAQQELRSLGFTPEQIVKIVAHDGGSKNIALIVANKGSLANLENRAELVMHFIRRVTNTNNREISREQFLESINENFNHKLDWLANLYIPDLDDDESYQAEGNFPAEDARDITMDEALQFGDLEDAAAAVSASVDIYDVVASAPTTTGSARLRDDNTPRKRAKRTTSNITIDEETKKYLKAFKITQRRYKEEVGKLQACGMSKDNCKKVILRRGSENIVQALVANYENLIQLGFSEENIAVMAAHENGVGNIETIISYKEFIYAFEESKRKAICEAYAQRAQLGIGSLSLEAYLLKEKQNTDAAAAATTTTTTTTSSNVADSRSDMGDDRHAKRARYVSHASGISAQSFNAPKILSEEELRRYKVTQNDYQRYFEVLIKNGIDRATCESMILRKDGQSFIEIVNADAFKLLCNPECFTFPEMVKLATCNNGLWSIWGLANHQYHALTVLGFNRHQIFKIAAHNDGCYNLSYVIERYQTLRSFGLNNEQITEIAGNFRGNKYMEALVQLFDTLRNVQNVAQLIMGILYSTDGLESFKSALKARLEENRLIEILELTTGTPLFATSSSTPFGHSYKEGSSLQTSSMGNPDAAAGASTPHSFDSGASGLQDSFTPFFGNFTTTHSATPLFTGSPLEEAKEIQPFDADASPGYLLPG